MDTSETYIKMRRMAIPFLGMGNPPRFSCGSEVSWRTTFVCTDLKGDFYYSSKDETFQLERQDQLQEMVIGKIAHWTTAVSGLNNLAKFAREIEFNSMEQLWLAFVMKEKYNKTWNGEDWI